METGSLLDVFLFLSTLLLFFGSRPGINGVGTGFTTSGSQSMGGEVSPCAGSAERLPLSCTDRLWDLWVCTIAYVERLFDCFLSISSLSYSCTGLCSPGGLHLKRGMM